MSTRPALWILLMVLYGCETWSLTLREEHRLRVFENRELRRIFRPKRDQMTEGWRKLRNGDLHNLYSSPSIIRMISQGGCDGQGMQHELGRRGILIRYWLIQLRIGTSGGVLWRQQWTVGFHKCWEILE
jgi:hypothetical protein